MSSLASVLPLAGGSPCARAARTLLRPLRVQTILAVVARSGLDERILRECELRARLVLEEAADPLFVHDAAGCLIDVNDRASEVLGYSREELLSMRVTDVDVDYTSERALATWAEVSPSSRHVLKSRHRRKDGAIFPVEVRFSSFVVEGERYFLGLARDLTETERVEADRARANEALRVSEERYRLLVDNLPQVVFSTDLEGRITFVNSAIRHFGYRADEVIGRPRDDFVHPDDRAPSREARLRQVAAGTGSQSLEYRLIDAQGKCRYVRSVGRPLLADGELVGMTGIIIDLTEQRETEARLRAAQKMEAIGQLAGGVAHDFNNLLCVILSYAELIELGLAPGDPTRADLRGIIEASRRAEALTRQLLAFGRRQVLAPEPLELNALVLGVGNMLRRLIGEHVELELRTAPSLHRVKADKSQLEQVIMNLVVNARDAMPQGGRVVVSTANVVLDAARGTALELAPGDYVELAVADSGVGMDAATMLRIFDPFFTTKPVGRGTGLGLSTVYGIVKQSGAGITVESAPGEGATFRIYLRRHDDAASRAQPSSPEPTRRS
jgi:two-component system cell cycle sensor histidine kinase/response regulator CckA